MTAAAIISTAASGLILVAITAVGYGARRLSQSVDDLRVDIRDLRAEVSALQVDAPTRNGETREWVRQLIDQRIRDHRGTCQGAESSGVHALPLP
jgi:hypothetical protein